jgi:hypothetical protein
MTKQAQFTGDIYDVTNPENPIYITSQYVTPADNEAEAKQRLIKETSSGDSSLQGKTLEVRNISHY